MSDKSTLIKLCNEILAWEQEREAAIELSKMQESKIDRLERKIETLIKFDAYQESLADADKMDFILENWSRLTLERLENLLKSQKS